MRANESNRDPPGSRGALSIFYYRYRNGPVRPALARWISQVVQRAGPEVLASSLRFFLQIKAQGMTTPSHAAVILMLEAVWTALFAAWWFGETMTALQLLGCSLIFMALLINRWYWVRKVLLRWLPGGNPSR